MSSLFGKKRKKVTKRKREETPASTSAKSTAHGAKNVSNPWLELGLNQWLVKSCRAMGLRVPTPVQVGCIPAILQGRDVIGCAPTGSGKVCMMSVFVH
jgi:superfamily II DNA/RNA helicase